MKAATANIEFRNGTVLKTVNFSRAATILVNDFLRPYYPDSEIEPIIAHEVKALEMLSGYNPDYSIFLATHSQGTKGPKYIPIERNSNGVFWAISMFTKPIPTREGNVKDVDMIVVLDDVIIYVIEVKWGDVCIDSTDITEIFQSSTIEKIRKMVNQSVMCQVTGPKVERGELVRKSDKKQINLDNDTIFLLISDFFSMKHSNFDNIKTRYLSFNDLFKETYTGLDREFHAIDYNSSTDQFLSLEQYLER